MATPTPPAVDEQMALLERGVVDLVDADQLRSKLERSRASGRPLTIKAGFDPSAPDLHLGHAVLLRKMRQFQLCGHRVVFVVGDFTARIGDPSGRKAGRPQLSREEIAAHQATYERQVYRVLDREATVLEHNSRWLDALGSDGLVRLAGRWTLARMMEREDFRKRYEGGQPIGIHELLYPLVQGYDSVALNCDVELGGHDQIFNLLVGRDLMREDGLEPQVVMTVPLLVGLDGSEKMSKSLGNAIALEDPATEMFGRVMSIPDELMLDWARLLTDAGPAELAAREAALAGGSLHPKQFKLELAAAITTDFHGAEEAQRAREEFERVFAGGGLPDAVPVATAPAQPLAGLLADLGLTASKGEARRLILQGAVSADGERLADPFLELVARPEPYLLRVGKRRFCRVTIS